MVVPTGDSCDDNGADTLVVPMLAYFDNGLGSDLVAKSKGLSLEVVVPPATAACGAKANT